MGTGALFSTRRTRRRGTASAPPCPAIINFGVTDFPELYCPSFQPLASPRTPKPCTTRASLKPGTTVPADRRTTTTVSWPEQMSQDRFDVALSPDSRPKAWRGSPDLPCRYSYRHPGSAPGSGPISAGSQNLAKPCQNPANQASSRHPSSPLDGPTEKRAKADKNGQRGPWQTSWREAGKAGILGRPTDEARRCPSKGSALKKSATVTSGVPCEVTHE